MTYRFTQIMALFSINPAILCPNYGEALFLRDRCELKIFFFLTKNLRSSEQFEDHITLLQIAPELLEVLARTNTFKTSHKKTCKFGRSSILKESSINRDHFEISSKLSDFLSPLTLQSIEYIMDWSGY